MKNPLNRIVWLLFAFLVLGVASGECQIPDEFTNLKVLPRDISKPDLVKAMRSFTSALGVRCLFCHVGEEGKPMSTFNFASDEKEQKRTARLMMTMMQDINQKYLTGLGKPAEKLVQVSCATCHHGQQEPRMIEDIVRAALNQDGPAAAAKKYEELRKQYYGSFVFDFSEAPLNRVGRSYLDDGKVTDGIEVMKLNEKYFPASGQVQFWLAELYLKSGAKPEALLRYKKCLELDPENDDAKKRIEELTPKPK